jgi:hypothetical protein
MPWPLIVMHFFVGRGLAHVEAARRNHNHLGTLGAVPEGIRGEAGACGQQRDAKQEEYAADHDTVKGLGEMWVLRNVRSNAAFLYR